MLLAALGAFPSGLLAIADGGWDGILWTRYDESTISQETQLPDDATTPN